MKLDQSIINVISESIPKHIKIVDYLMDALDLGKDSVYRRIRGEIPFTFGEIAKLASLLNFSLDEIIGRSETQIASFKIQPNILLDSQQTFSLMLDEYYKNLRDELNCRKVEVFITCNCILLPTALFFDNLFKFMYFKWTYQRYELDLNVKYSDVGVPSEIIRLCDKIRQVQQCSNSDYTYIMDKNIFINMAEQFQYYYKRKIITLDELNLLKSDLVSYIKRTEQIARHGSNVPGINYYYYLSTLNVESNTTYVRYDNVPRSYFWIYSVSPIDTTHEISCGTHKKWIDSIKKYSVFISQSNDILMAEFFNNQYKLIDKMFQVEA